MARAREESWIGRLGDLKAEYEAARDSRFRRRRTGLGGNADAHVMSPQQMWIIREYVRDMDRNDSVIGQLVDRANDNIVRNGPRPEPNTGDSGLDRALKDMWADFWCDPFECDARQQFSGPEMDRFVLRHQFIDGDIFAILTDDEGIQLHEADRCISPTYSRNSNIVHGVLKDDRDRRLGFYFTKKWMQQWRSVLVADTQFFDRVDEDGELRVLQMYDPKRVTQTRGLTAFHAILNTAGMLEDTEFAMLVQAQMVACIAWFLEQTEADTSPPPKSDSELAPKDPLEHLQALSPGQFLKGKKGQKLHGFQPNVPNPTHMPFIKHQLRKVGANIGMPLELVLMDLTDSKFHGYRGAMEQAKIGFRCRQTQLDARWNRPKWRWFVRMMKERGELSNAALRKRKVDPFRHAWKHPRWPYVDPKTDAEADVVRLNNIMISPTALAAEQDRSYEETLDQTVRDNTLAIETAIEASHSVFKRTGVEVPWIQFLKLTLEDQDASEALVAQAVAETDEQDGDTADDENPLASRNGVVAA